MLRSAGDNDRRSKRFRCALRTFHVKAGQDSVIRLRVIEGPYARQQIAFWAFHSFFVGVQMNANYLHVRHA